MRGLADCRARCDGIDHPLSKGEIVGTSPKSSVEARRNVEREEKDWIRLDAPDLRIITPDLWNTVQVRLSKTKGKGRSAFRDQDSKYLLTGLARCAHCGGPMTIVGQDYHRHKGRFYGWSCYKTRGPHLQNSLLVEHILDQSSSSRSMRRDRDMVGWRSRRPGPTSVGSRRKHD